MPLRLPRPTARGILLTVLAAGALAVALERLILTDREAIGQLLDRAADAVVLGDYDRLTQTLDPGFTADGRDRDESVVYARTMRNRYRPTELKVTPESVEVDGDAARARADLTARVMGMTTHVALNLSFVRTHDGWRLIAATQAGPAR